MLIICYGLWFRCSAALFQAEKWFKSPLEKKKVQTSVMLKENKHFATLFYLLMTYHLINSLLTISKTFCHVCLMGTVTDRSILQLSHTWRQQQFKWSTNSAQKIVMEYFSTDCTLLIKINIIASFWESTAQQTSHEIKSNTGLKEL